MSDIHANPLSYYGVLGYLDDQQTDKLKGLWKVFLNVIDECEEASSSVSHSQSSLSVRRSSSLDTDSLSPSDKASLSQARKSVGRYGTKRFLEAYWAYVAMDYPDTMMLKFLRARRWDVYAALLQLVECIAWRIDVQVDKLMQEGEEGRMKEGDEGFMQRLKVGEAYIYGTDRDKRPVLYVHVRLHKSLDSSESQSAVQNYVLYLMESSRYFLMHPNDRITLIFDLTGFGLSNMDWKSVHFLRQCFTQYYPECLNAVLVHNAPWVFWGIWKILSPLVDPVVKSKIQFTRSPEDLKIHIDESHLISKLGGEAEYEWQYTPPVEGENAGMADQDGEMMKVLVEEREQLTGEFLRLTRVWSGSQSALSPSSTLNLSSSSTSTPADTATPPNSSASISTPAATSGSSQSIEVLEKSRRVLSSFIRVNYLALDPYIRARGVFHRLGNVLGDGRAGFVYCTSSHNEAEGGNEGERGKKEGRIVEVLGEERSIGALNLELKNALDTEDQGVSEELRPKMPEISPVISKIFESMVTDADRKVAELRQEIVRR